MNAINETLNQAVAQDDVPFVVAMAANSDGIIYSGAAGKARPDMDASTETAFRIFSMTKAIGSTAAMILIDRGELSMGTPVADIMPEWNDLQVLDGFEGDKPILRPQKTVATIRNLATHTSGMEYEFWCPDMGQYMQATEHPSMLTGTRAALMAPLMTDPGTRWGYGPSIDWLGRVVEEVSGKSIVDFCQAEIFDPLGMKDTAFEPDALVDRLADIGSRGEDGRFAPFELAPPPQPEIYGMGHALYSTAPDYLRFLRMVLRKGELDGARVLSEAAVAEMTADQMNGLTFQTMHSIAPPVSVDVEMPEGTTHSFAFVRFEQDQPGKRSAGSQSWAGVLNTHYWIDPAKDLAAVVMTQSLPFLEPGLQKTYDAYERALYASL